MESNQQDGGGTELRTAVPVRPAGQRSQDFVVGDLLALAELASPDGSQTEKKNEVVDDGEPKFPEQVYNVLVVGSARVGQTSFILYDLIPNHRFHR